MKLAYKYRFYPTQEQADVLNRTFGCVRYVYNFGLALRRDANERDGATLKYKDTSAALTLLKTQEETTWLREVSSVPLQQTLRHLDRAFTGFFEKRTGYLQFKRKHARQSATYTRSAFTYRVDDGTPGLQLAKMAGSLDVRWSRAVPSEPSTVTVSRDAAGRYFASLLCDVEPEALPPTEKKGSNRYQKQRRRVARVHARIKDRRQDHLHKLSTKLIRENQTVCLESLNVQGMLRSGRLARHIAGAAWSELVRQLEYKAELYGRQVVRIDPWFPSSKQCSNCGKKVDEMPLSIRRWNCEACSTVHDRDVNAAINILAVGQAVLARGGVGKTERRPRVAISTNL